MIVREVDGKRLVEGATPTVVVTGELLDHMEQAGHTEDGLYVFDSAGKYRYRKVGPESFLNDTWVLERVE